MKKIGIFLVGLIFLFAPNAFSNQKEWTSLNKVLQDKLELKNEMAALFFVDSVTTAVDELLQNLQSIANPLISSDERKQIVVKTINMFESANSWVQVSTIKSSNKPETISISEYLNRLGYLAAKKAYSKIVITLHPNKRYSGIEKTSDPIKNVTYYSFDLSIWQHFAGFREGELIYADGTRKLINFKATKNSNGLYDLIISKISVSQTIPLTNARINRLRKTSSYGGYYEKSM